MMWLEALLACLLVLAALSLTLQAAPPAHPLLDFYSYQALQDKAAAIVEMQTHGGSNSSGAFFDADAYCYRYAWSDQPDSYSYSSPNCQSAFSTPPPATSTVRRGAWKDGHLQFLIIEQAPMSSS